MPEFSANIFQSRNSNRNVTARKKFNHYSSASASSRKLLDASVGNFHSTLTNFNKTRGIQSEREKTSNLTFVDDSREPELEFSSSAKVTNPTADEPLCSKAVRQAFRRHIGCFEFRLHGHAASAFLFFLFRRQFMQSGPRRARIYNRRPFVC